MSQQPNPAAFPPGFFFIQSQRFPTLTVDVYDGSMTVSAATVILFWPFTYSPFHVVPKKIVLKKKIERRKYFVMEEGNCCVTMVYDIGYGCTLLTPSSQKNRKM